MYIGQIVVRNKWINVWSLQSYYKVTRHLRVPRLLLRHRTSKLEYVHQNWFLPQWTNVLFSEERWATTSNSTLEKKVCQWSSFLCFRKKNYFDTVTMTEQMYIDLEIQPIVQKLVIQINSASFKSSHENLRPLTDCSWRME